MDINYIKELTETTERSKRNEKRIEQFDELLNVVHEMNTNIHVIATNVKHQSKTMDSLVESHNETKEEVDEIKSKMETKEDVDKLRERILELEKKSGLIAIKAWKYVAGIIASVIGGFILAMIVGAM